MGWRWTAYRFLAVLAASLIPAFIGGAARAQALEVAPISVEMPPGLSTTTLTITNRGTIQAAVQARAFSWSQTAREDNLAATDQLAVSPPIFQIAPGQSQLLRILLRRPAATREETYRILLDQIPPAAGSGQVQVAIRISLPVFALPDARVAAALRWRVVAAGAAADLVVANGGGRHERVVQPVVTGSAGAKIAVSSDTGPYVLAGNERHWALSGGGTALRPGSVLHVTALTVAGPVDTTLTVEPGP